MRRLLASMLFGFLVFPFVLVIALSFSRSWIYPRLIPELTAQRWAELLSGRGGLAEAFFISVVLSFTVAAISTAASYVTARYVSYHPHRDVILTAAYAPYVMSPVVLGVCILYLYIRMGVDGTFVGLMMAQTIFAFSFGVIFFAAFWNREKLELEQLVHTLGGSSWDAYRRVLIPMSREALLLCFFQTFLISWFQYGLTMLIGGGRVQTLPLKVFDYIAEANVSYAAVASCLLILPPLLLLWVNRRVIARIG